MALAQPRRDSIYRKLVPVMGEEDAEALLLQFPSSESDEPATCAYVDTKIAEVRADLAELRAEVVGVKGDLKTEIIEVKGDLMTEIIGVKGDLMTEIAGGRADLQEALRKQTIWVTTAIILGGTLIRAIEALI